MATTNQNWTDEHLRLVDDDGIVGFGKRGVWTAVSNLNGGFRLPRLVLEGFGLDHGWRVDQHPRLLADLTGDGRADIVGFGSNGVATALSKGDGTLQSERFVLDGFGVKHGWRVDQHPRLLADLTGDGRADIVGFGAAGVATALSNGDGSFQPARLVLEGFSVDHGWRVDQHPRLLADLTGDGRADIVGFGAAGVATALSNGDGSFQPARLVLEGFSVNHGWRVDQHPRLLADLTGDGRADIVGFGAAGVATALSNGDGSFQPARLVLEAFHVDHGWRVDQHPRLLADLTGDGRADIVGFGRDGVWTALSNGDGTFQPARLVERVFPEPPHPRFVVLTGNRRADVVRLTKHGVATARSNGDGTFVGLGVVLDDFGAETNNPIAAPTGLRVTNVADRQIGLAWTDDSDNEDGFRIQFRGKRAGFTDHTGTKSVSRGVTSASLVDLRGNHEYTISVVAFNAGGESQKSNEVRATTPTTPITPKTVVVNLTRQPIGVGTFFPYVGFLGLVPAGHVIQIKVPSPGVVPRVAFVKTGHSTEQCGDPNAVVIINKGQTTSPAQMTAIFGVPKPPYSAASPLGFVACVDGGNLPGFFIEVTIVSDE